MGECSLRATYPAALQRDAAFQLQADLHKADLNRAISAAMERYPCMISQHTNFLATSSLRPRLQGLCRAALMQGKYSQGNVWLCAMLPNYLFAICQACCTMWAQQAAPSNNIGNSCMCEPSTEPRPGRSAGSCETAALSAASDMSVCECTHGNKRSSNGKQCHRHAPLSCCLQPVA